MQGQFDTDRDKVARLTSKQYECMRLVVLRKSSKEIARELGIAKPTVDQRIANARQTLGARNRDEAAIIFSRGTSEYDRVIYDTACVSQSDLSWKERDQETRPNIGLRLEETATPYSGAVEHQPTVPIGLRWSPSGNISVANRLLIIVGMTVGILSIVLVGLAVAQSLSELLTAS
jgi:DNA-binding CsgD family transcriptional regulator